MASQTITGPDLQYTQDNLRCFAYSGAIGSTSGSTATQTLLDFKTKSAYIDAKLLFFATSGSNNSLRLKLQFNDYNVLENNAKGYYNEIPFWSDLIIPPFTHVVFKWDIENEGADKGYAVLRGRVYEYLSVRN